MQKILSTMRRAITDYNMISDGDKIVVGVSGGKDSLLLLTALKAFQRFSPAKFDLAAITIDMGFKDASVAENRLCRRILRNSACRITSSIPILPKSSSRQGKKVIRAVCAARCAVARLTIRRSSWDSINSPSDITPTTSCKPCCCRFCTKAGFRLSSPYLLWTEAA